MGRAHLKQRCARGACWGTIDDTVAELQRIERSVVVIEQGLEICGRRRKAWPSRGNDRRRGESPSTCFVHRHLGQVFFGRWHLTFIFYFRPNGFHVFLGVLAEKETSHILRRRKPQGCVQYVWSTNHLQTVQQTVKKRG